MGQWCIFAAEPPMTRFVTQALWPPPPPPKNTCASSPRPHASTPTQAQGCDTVITCGGVQSNHCRATAIAARECGLDSYLIQYASDPTADPGLAGVPHGVVARPPHPGTHPCKWPSGQCVCCVSWTPEFDPGEGQGRPLRARFSFFVPLKTAGGYWW